MHTFFVLNVVPPTSHPPPTPNLPIQTEEPKKDWANLFNYPLDLSDDSDKGSGTKLADGEAEEEPHNKWLPAVPQLKWQNLDKWLKDFEIAFVDIQKLIKSKMAFVGGRQGLQAHYVHTMESLLMLVYLAQWPSHSHRAVSMAPNQ